MGWKSAGPAILALVAGCLEPGDDRGGGSFDSCGAGLINLPTRESTWREEDAAGVLIGGHVHHSSCDEPELEIPVTVSNEKTGFSETQTASVECVQVFPTTGATQRNYSYLEYVPLAHGGNRIEVRARQSCASLAVDCYPCVNPPPGPDAGPPPDGGPDAGPVCDLVVTRPGALESETTFAVYEAAGTISSSGQVIEWGNATSGASGQMTYVPGETSWYGLVDLVESTRNTIEVTAWCLEGASASKTFYLTQVPP